jgi:hypothetical protein
MKRVLVTLLVAAFVVGGSLSIAFAAGPETLTFANKMGDVTFPHAAHQKTLGSCKPCHEGTPGKIEGFGKDWAHKTCKGCHQEKGISTSCKTCHKK